MGEREGGEGGPYFFGWDPFVPTPPSGFGLYMLLVISLNIKHIASKQTYSRPCTLTMHSFRAWITGEIKYYTQLFNPYGVFMPIAEARNRCSDL